MSEGKIQIPSYMLGLLGAAFTVAVSWGILQAETAHAQDERERISKIAQDAARQAVENGQQVAVNSTKLEVIVQSLSEQKEIQQKTNDQIAALVQAMLAKD